MRPLRVACLSAALHVVMLYPCCHSERGLVREVMIYNRLWRHVPLPLAKDMFAMLWHGNVIDLVPDSGTKTRAPGTFAACVGSAAWVAVDTKTVMLRCQATPRRCWTTRRRLYSDCRSGSRCRQALRASAPLDARCSTTLR